MLLKELRVVARAYDLKGRSKLKKHDLEIAIAEMRAVEFSIRIKRILKKPKKFPALLGDVEDPSLYNQRVRELKQLDDEVDASLKVKAYIKRTEKKPLLRLKYLKNISNRFSEREVFEKPPETLMRKIINRTPKLLEELRTIEKELKFNKSKRALGKYLFEWRMDIHPNNMINLDPKAFLDSIRPQIYEKLAENLESLGGLKFNLALKVHFTKKREDGAMEFIDAVFRHKQEALLQENEIEESLDKAIPYILEMIDSWTYRGSGWIIERVDTLWLDLAKYEPFKGGAGIETPKVLLYKHAIINVQTEEDDCFEVAILSAEYPVNKDPQRLSKYIHLKGKLNMEGMKKPTPISQIPKFEKQNNLAVNVFGWDHKKVLVYYLSKRDDSMKRINLMLLEEKEKFHYTWIKDFNRLLYNQSRHKERKHFCERCLYGFSNSELLESHKIDCRGVGKTAVSIEMPSAKKNKVKFMNYHKQIPMPYVIYADFEALIVNTNSIPLDPTQSNTQITDNHEVCGYSYIAVRYDGFVHKPVLYRGPGAVKHFLNSVVIDTREIKNKLNVFKAQIMTLEDMEKYKAATHCYICDKPLDKDRLHDHCTITGKYRGAAHKKCSQSVRIKPNKLKIPVVFHNLRGYDCHLIMQAISKVGGKISCIANNMEKYISLDLGHMRIIDSIQFLLYPLADLVKLNKPEKFKITAKNVLTKEQYKLLGESIHKLQKGNLSEEEEKETKEVKNRLLTNRKLKLLLQKGIYPYEYMDSWDKFEETKLPPKEAFYSKLSGKHISMEEYEHAQNVWDAFKCKDLGDYHDLYLRTDVLLLADVFEAFRKTCLLNYKLDSSHYLSGPGLSWDALLKMTGVELELLTDYDQHLFVEKGIRGGISRVSKRYAKANNPMVEGYEADKPNTFIHYLDANNLYGWAMCQSLPISDFKWKKDCEALENVILNHPENDPIGYILEVDLEYPESLHEQHSDYPLAPERLVVQKEWLSDYQLDLLNAGVASTEVPKLVPNLFNKERYVLHYRNLQLYMRLGMKLTNIHRVLQFKQSPWMKPYIQKNTELRKLATSDFEKDLFKLMNNAVFGKTMENLRKRVNITLLRADETNKLRKLIASPSFARAKIFDDDIAAIKMHKTHLKLNKPIYAGLSILDLSKYFMYDFYYNEMKKEYGERCRLLYTDTDSLLLEIQTENIHNDMVKHADLYDTSNYPQDHPLFTNQYKKVVGKMKDESAGRVIEEYVGLKAKMYSIKEVSGKNIKKAKGIKKATIRDEIHHSHYKEALLEKRTFRHGMNSIRSYNHRLYNVHLNKISLSPYDSKAWITENGVDTLSFGDKRITPNSFYRTPPLGGSSVSGGTI